MKGSQAMYTLEEYAEALRIARTKLIEKEDYIQKLKDYFDAMVKVILDDENDTDKVRY